MEAGFRDLKAELDAELRKDAETGGGETAPEAEDGNLKERNNDLKRSLERARREKTKEETDCQTRISQLEDSVRQWQARARHFEERLKANESNDGVASKAAEDKIEIDRLHRQILELEGHVRKLEKKSSKDESSRAAIAAIDKAEMSRLGALIVELKKRRCKN